jgi:hypothetical protein
MENVGSMEYSINCQIENRLFLIASYGSTTSAEKQRKFEEDLVRHTY